MTKIFYLLSHPIQYFSPLLSELNKQEDIDLVVYYCTDHTLKKAVDKQFGQVIEWDTNLLEGYRYNFLKNYSRKPELAGKSSGLINLGIFKALRKEKPNVLILHGWAYFTNILALFSAKLLGIEVLMRSESPLKQENSKGLKRLLKKIILKYFCDKFLYIGIENKAFYKSFGISDDKLFFTPYAVDNRRFELDFAKEYHRKEGFREQLGIPKGNLIILFSGKFIFKKRPFDLLQAIVNLKESNVFLILLGSGELEKKMKEFINENNLSNKILLPGFINQSQLYKYFISSDVFILPSGKGETWGLVINEAMNFHLPIISSDLVGCSADLVQEGENGFIYECGNINELTNKIKFFLDNPSERSRMGESSSNIIQSYSINNIVKGIIAATQ